MAMDAAWLERAMIFVAELVAIDAVYVPIFERLEHDLALLNASPVERARAIARSGGRFTNSTTNNERSSHGRV